MCRVYDIRIYWIYNGYTVTHVYEQPYSHSHISQHDLSWPQTSHPIEMNIACPCAILSKSGFKADTLAVLESWASAQTSPQPLKQFFI